MASSTVGIGLTIGAVAQGSVGSVLFATRRSLDGLTKSSRALDLAQQRVGRSIKRGLTAQQGNYDRLGRSLARVRTAHERLTMAAARSNAAIASGQQSWTRLATTAMAAWGTIRGAVATAGQAASFADSLRDTRIKGRLSAEQEQALGASVRANVATTNQSRGDLMSGAHQLIAGGSSFAEVESQIGLMGDTMTALRTSSEETTGAMLALRDMGALDRESMQGGIERLIAIGDRGQFTPDMMIRAFAQLGDTIKASGVKGENAIAEMAAGLQIAEGSMGAAGAQAGLQSWLSGLNDPKIAAAYERAGVDYKTSMADLQKSGMSQYQASLELAGAFVRDSLSAKDQQALLKGEDDGRISTMLSEMGLGEIFKDVNAARYALATQNNKDAYKDMSSMSGESSLASLKALREESPIEQMKALKNSASELAVEIGNALLPSLLGVVNTLTPMVAGIRDFVQANPGVVSAIGSIVAGFVGFRVASVAGVFAFRQVMIVATQGTKVFRLLRAGMALAQAQMMLFRSGTLLASGTLGGKLITSLKSVGRVFTWLGRAFLANPIGIAVMAIAGAAYLIYEYWEPIKEFFSGLWDGITGIFSAAWNGITSGLSAVWNGAQSMATSIWGGLTGFFGGLWDGIASVTESAWDAIGSGLSSAWNGISSVAESVWDGLRNFFGGLWDEITTAFDGGIVGVGKLILDWSPLGLFYKVFASVFDWFGIELPEKFSGFGGMIIEGLVSGITSMVGSVKDSVVGVADDIGNWFSETLGINSPSRVFMALGSSVPEGAAKGITGSVGLVKQAALGMAAASAVTLAAPTVSAPDVAPVPAAFVQGSRGVGFDGGGIVINFSPTINVQGAGNLQEINQALNRASDDLEQRIRQVMREEKMRERRRAYDQIGVA